MNRTIVVRLLIVMVACSFNYAEAEESFQAEAKEAHDEKELLLKGSEIAQHDINASIFGLSLKMDRYLLNSKAIKRFSRADEKDLIFKLARKVTETYIRLDNKDKVGRIGTEHHTMQCDGYIRDSSSTTPMILACYDAGQNCYAITIVFRGMSFAELAQNFSSIYKKEETYFSLEKYSHAFDDDSLAMIYLHMNAIPQLGITAMAVYIDRNN